jgi:hypothetical protein
MSVITLLGSDYCTLILLLLRYCHATSVLFACYWPFFDSLLCRYYGMSRCIISLKSHINISLIRKKAFIAQGAIIC